MYESADVAFLFRTIQGNTLFSFFGRLQLNKKLVNFFLTVYKVWTALKPRHEKASIIMILWADSLNTFLIQTLIHVLHLHHDLLKTKRDISKQISSRKKLKLKTFWSHFLFSIMYQYIFLVMIFCLILHYYLYWSWESGFETFIFTLCVQKFRVVYLNPYLNTAQILW